MLRASITSEDAMRKYFIFANLCGFALFAGAGLAHASLRDELRGSHLSCPHYDIQFNSSGSKATVVDKWGAHKASVDWRPNHAELYWTPDAQDLDACLRKEQGKYFIDASDGTYECEWDCRSSDSNASA
jgi:hypothetical protein